MDNEYDLEIALHVLVKQEESAEERIKAYNFIYNELKDAQLSDPCIPKIASDAQKVCDSFVREITCKKEDPNTSALTAALQLLGIFLRFELFTSKLSCEVCQDLICGLCSVISSMDKTISKTALCCLSSWKNAPDSALGETMGVVISTLEAIMSDQKVQSLTVEYEGMRCIHWLITSHLDSTRDNIKQCLTITFPRLFHCAVKIRNIAVSIFEASIPYINCNRNIIQHLTIIIKENLHTGMDNLFNIGLECFALKTWCMIVKILGKSLHHGCSLINCMLEVVERGFKSQKPEVRISAFVAWRELIDNFACDPNILSSSKRLKLILEPLKINNARTDAVIQVKLDVWGHLMIMLNDHLANLFELVVVPSFHYCLGPIPEINESVNTSRPSLKTGISATFVRPDLVSKIGCKILASMLGNPEIKHDKLSSPSKFRKESSKCDLMPLNCEALSTPQFFLKHSSVFFLATKYSQKVLSSNASDSNTTLMIKIWSLLATHIVNISELPNSTEAVRRFFKIIEEIILSNNDKDEINLLSDKYTQVKLFRRAHITRPFGEGLQTAIVHELVNGQSNEKKAVDVLVEMQEALPLVSRQRQAILAALSELLTYSQMKHAIEGIGTKSIRTAKRNYQYDHVWNRDSDACSINCESILREIVLHLTQKLLTSPTYHVGSTNLMLGTPSSFLLAVMLKSNIVNVCNEEGLSYSRFLELYKKLISYTIQGNATSTLSFCQSVIQLLTDAVSSISRAESLLQLWVILVEILCGQINKSQEVNQGDSMSHDFTCIYHTLLFPAKFLFTKMFESSSSKLMHSTWNKLYKTFTYCASLVVNLSDNIWCEELCAKLLSLISDQSDFSLDTFYLINNLTKVIVSITDDIQMSAVNDVDTDNIKSKTSAKKNYLKPLKASKVLRNIKSLVGLISKVIFNEAESVKCLESTFQNKVIMAANEAVWCELIKVLSKLFRNIHNSDVLFKLLEELSFPISVLLAQPVKEKVDGLWSDVTQSLQLHYSGLYDDKMLELCTPLLKVTLCHSSSVIKKNTRLFWHSTFGQSASLNYPDDLKVVMEKVHPPLISDIQEVSEDSMMSSPLLSFKDVNNLRIPPQINPDRNKFGQNGSFLEKSPLKSPVKIAKSPSKTSLTALASKNSQKSPARRSILNTSIDDMDTQVYAPNEDAHDNEKDSFYEELNSTIKEHKKSRDQLIIMGDFNAKVGAGKEQQIIGPYGIGIRNENGEKLVDFCKQQKLIATNTWFEQKESSRHTWISPDGNTKNQLDYILLSERYRNSAKNSKARPGADCGSDHNPVVLKLKTTMKKLKSKQMGLHWNTEKLKEDKVRGEFREQIERKLGEVCTKEMSSEVLWNKFKKDIHEVAHQSCGKNNPEKKQPWITVEILNLMIERRKLKNPKNSKNNIRYKQMCRNIQKSCREAKETYYRDKCEELEELDAKHSPKLYVKIKELQQKKPRIKLGLRNKEGVVLQEDDDIKKRWHEYDFVPIKTPPSTRKRILTKHQKEVLKNERFVPPMYNDLSQDNSELSSQFFSSDTQDADSQDMTRWDPNPRGQSPGLDSLRELASDLEVNFSNLRKEELVIALTTVFEERGFNINDISSIVSVPTETKPTLASPQNSFSSAGCVTSFPIQLSAPQPFDISSEARAPRWEFFKREFEIYVTAIGLLDDRRKVAVLLHCAGSDMQRIVETLPVDINTISFPELLKVITEYFTPIDTTRFDRFKLFEIAQHSSETTSDFVTRLRQQSRLCRFTCPKCNHSLEDDRLLDVLLRNTANESLRRKVFEKGFNGLNEVLALSRGLESAASLSRQMADIRGDLSSGINVTSSLKPQRRSHNSQYRPTTKPMGSGSSSYANKPLRKCKFCDLVHEFRRGMCTAYGNKCPKCNQYNHLAVCCDSLHSQDNQANPNVYAADGFGGCLYHMEGKRQAFCTLTVCGSKRTFLIDTGASHNCIPKHYVPNTYTLDSAPVVTCYGGSSINPLGSVFLPVSKNDGPTTLIKFLVVDYRQPLLSLQTSVKFDFVSLNPSSVFTVNSVQFSDISSLLSEFEDLFSPELGCVQDVLAHIQLKSDVKPKFYRHRPVPLALKAVVESTLDAMVQRGTLQPVRTSMWASPMVTVAKPDGSVRLCADYTQTLKNAIDIEAYPLPLPDELFASLSGNKVFSKIDLRTCFEQFRLDDDSKEILTVNTIKGLMRYERLPYGIASAPAIVQRAMEEILRGLDVRRYAMRLAMFDYSVEHRSGPRNSNADALSRAPVDQAPVVVDECELFMISCIQSLPLDEMCVAEETAKDPVLAVVLSEIKKGWSEGSPTNLELTPYWRKRRELSVIQATILWGRRVVLPHSLQQKMLSILHDTHQGIVKMKSLARLHVWWPKIDDDLQSMVGNCTACQRVASAPPSRNLPWPAVGPWERLHLDFGSFDGHVFLVLVDAGSKWIEAEFLRSTTSEATLRTLFSWFTRFGYPKTIHTDGGPQFTSSTFREKLHYWGVQHTISPPYHPESNGLAERAVRTIKDALRKNNSSVSKLESVLFRYRVTPLTSGPEKTPSELLLGYNLRTRLSVAATIQKPTKITVRNPYIKGDKLWVRDYRKNTPKWECLSNDLEKSINSTTCEKIKNPIRSVDPSECSSHSLKESENNLNNNSCVNVHTDEINSEKNPGAINSNTKVDDEMKPKSTMKSSEMDRSNIQSLSSQSLETIDKTTPKCHHSKDEAVKYPTSAVGVMIYPLKSDNGLIKKQVFRVPLHCVQDWKLKTKSAVSIARFALNEGLNEEASTPEIVEETPSEQIGQCDEFVPSSQNTEVAELVEPSSLPSNIHEVQTTLVPTNDDKIMPDTPTKRKVGRPRKDSSKLPTTPVKSKIFDSIEKASVSKINSSSESIISDVNSKNLMSIRSHSHRTRTMSVPSKILKDVKNYSRKSLESSTLQLNSENVLIDSESRDITASSSDKTPVKPASDELSDCKAQVLSVKSRVDRRKTKTPVKFNGNKLFRDKKVNATEMKHNVKLKEISDDSESYNKTKNESESHLQATDSTDSSVTSSKSLKGVRGKTKQKFDDGTLQQSDHIETQRQPVNTKFKTANENLDSGTKLCADKPSNDSSLIDSEISQSKNRKVNDSQSDQSNNESESYKTESESDMQATNSTDSSAAPSKSLKRKRGRPKQKSDDGKLQQSDRIETQTQPVNTKFKTANEILDSGSKLCVDKPSNDSRSDQSNNDGESYKTESESDMQATNSTDSSAASSKSLKRKRGRPKQTQPVNTKFKTANENFDSGSMLCVDKPSNDSRSDQSNNDGESDMQATNSTDSSVTSGESLRKKRGRPKQKCDDGKLQQSDRNETQTQPVNKKFKTPNENFDSDSKLCVDKPSNDPSSINNEISQSKNRKANDSQSDLSNNNSENYKTENESESLIQAPNSTDSSVTSSESLKKKRGRPKQKCDDGKLQQSDRNETQTQPVNKKFKTPNENFDSGSKLCMDKPSNDSSSINSEISQSENRKANDSQSDQSNKNNSAKLNRRRSCRIDKKNNVDEKLPSGSEAPVESSFNFKHSSNDMDATQDSALDVHVLPKSSTSSELITDMNVVSISSSPTHDNRTDNSCTTDLVQISDSDSPKISSCSSQSDESIKLESESIAIEYLNSPTVISEPESDIHLPPSVAQSSKSDQKFHESPKLKATENFKQTGVLTDAPNLSEIGKEEIVKENQTLQLGSSQQDNSDLHSAVVESVSSLVSDVTREAREDSPQTPNTNHGICHQRTISSVESISLLDDDAKQETNKDAVGSQTSNTCVLPISKDNCISETVTSTKNLASYVTIGNSEGDVILSEKHKHMKESNELKPVTSISKDGDNNTTSRLIEDSKIVVEVVGENRKDVKLLNLEKMVETADSENISSEKNVREGTEDDKINENELQDSLEKSISDDSLSKGKIGCSNQTICYNSDMISPMSRAHKILQASLASNVSSELSNVQKKEKKFTSPVTQPQKKYFPSPSASPSPSILKKRIVEDSFKKSYSSPKSKRHVSFADPPVLTEAEISLTNHDYLGRKPKKRPVNRCLQPVNDLLEEDLTSSFEMESCDTQQLNSEESIECNSAQPFFLSLLHVNIL
ncbi:hypothetical protein GQR58_010144 [Nymphon striatum]|nr:hypothetical protein GQR58_010144 [Nymphon striatum]